MWLNRLTNYLLRHQGQAVLFTFFISLVPFFNIFGILFAGFVTLTRGALSGGILTVATILPSLLSMHFAGRNPSTPLVFWAIMVVTVSSNILTWVFGIMLRRQTSWSAILQIAALFGVLVVSIIHLGFIKIDDWWGLQLINNYKETLAAASGTIKMSMMQSVEKQQEVINIYKQYATGIFLVFILASALSQLAISRWWQVILYNPGGLKPELQNIRLSKLAGLLFVVSLFLFYFGNQVILDIMPILLMLFATAGLSLIHYLFSLRSSSTNLLWLVILYVVVFLAMPSSMIILGIIALLDIWFNIRKQFRKI